MSKNLIFKLESLGCTTLKRSIVYQGIFINEFYLEDEKTFLDFCSNYIFKSKNTKDNKLKIAQLSSEYGFI